MNADTVTREQLHHRDADLRFFRRSDGLFERLYNLEDGTEGTTVALSGPLYNSPSSVFAGGVAWPQFQTNANIYEELRAAWSGNEWGDKRLDFVPKTSLTRRRIWGTVTPWSIRPLTRAGQSVQGWRYSGRSRALSSSGTDCTHSPFGLNQARA
jgi:hypothetical protein